MFVWLRIAKTTHSYFSIALQWETVKCCPHVVRSFPLFQALTQADDVLGCRKLPRIDGRRYPSYPPVAPFHARVRSLAFRGWLLLTQTSLVLFIIYFPSHLKYVDVVAQPVAHSEHTEVHHHTKSAEWKLAYTLSWIVAIHL
jgi:hypothetical protein